MEDGGWRKLAISSQQSAISDQQSLILSIDRRCHRFEIVESFVQVEKAPERVPVSPEVAGRAEDLVRRFSECFWFWNPDARVHFTGDVRLVISHLREYGDKQAWDAAADLQRSL